MSIESMLGHEVSVSDPVLMDFPGLVPDGRPMFHPSTMLIYGDHEAVLAEALLTVEQGKAVGVGRLSDKKLTHASPATATTGSLQGCWLTGSGQRSSLCRARSTRCGPTWPPSRSCTTSCGPACSRRPRSPCPATVLPLRATTWSGSAIATLCE